MTDQMIITRLRKVSAALTQDLQEYATQNHITLDAADEVRRKSCANMCELISEELEEGLKIEAEHIKKMANKGMVVDLSAKE